MALDLKKSELFLDIDQSSNYSIFTTSNVVGEISLPFFASEEKEGYQIELLSPSGKFSSGTGDIEYTLRGYELKSADFKHNLVYDRVQDELSCPLSFILPPGKILAPGTYVTDLPFKILKDGEVIRSSHIDVCFTVEEECDVRVYVDGDVYDQERIKVNFGEVGSETKKEVILAVKSNADVKVTLTSKNDGKMLLEDEGEFTPYFIPYVIEKGLKELSIAQGCEIESVPFTENRKEVTSSFSFVLKPNVEKTFTGKYRDQVCVTISSL